MANLFPRSANKAPLQIVLGLAVVVFSVGVAFAYYYNPKYSRAGYMPQQPVAFDHNLHVEQLGLDCRYCHSYVDQSGHSNVPDSATCMNCHSQVKKDSPALAPIRASYESGEPVDWVRIHKTPDYVYFNHAVHVNRGVSCVSCHGQINEMEVVYHAESLSMGFCLECHRNPEQFVRPLEHVYDLSWEQEDPHAQLTKGRELVHDWNINPPQSCSGCHR